MCQAETISLCVRVREQWPNRTLRVSPSENKMDDTFTYIYRHLPIIGQHINMFAPVESNVAMENPSVKIILPFKFPILRGFSIAMFDWWRESGTLPNSPNSPHWQSMAPLRPSSRSNPQSSAFLAWEICFGWGCLGGLGSLSRENKHSKVLFSSPKWDRIAIQGWVILKKTLSHCPG